MVASASSIFASSKAAKAQKQAAAQASAQQMAMYQQTRGDLAPFRQAGQDGMNMLMGKMNDFTTPITMDQAALEKTPGYQFNLQQGLKANQNSAAARGLGVSGAAFKGANSFATGLADLTYQNQFNNANTNQTNAFNRLMGVSTLGQNASAQTGAFGTQTATQVGNNIIGAGNAQAAAYMNMGNTVANQANAATNLLLAKGMYG